MLILQRKAGESLVIGDDITVRVISVDGSRVRLAIDAPEAVSILRSELITARAANRDSAREEAAPTELLDLLGGVLDHKRERPASGRLVSERPAAGQAQRPTASETAPPVPPEVKKED